MGGYPEVWPAYEALTRNPLRHSMDVISLFLLFSFVLMAYTEAKL